MPFLRQPPRAELGRHGPGWASKDRQAGWLGGSWLAGCLSCVLCAVCCVCVCVRARARASVVCCVLQGSRGTRKEDSQTARSAPLAREARSARSLRSASLARCAPSLPSALTPSLPSALTPSLPSAIYDLLERGGDASPARTGSEQGIFLVVWWGCVCRRGRGGAVPEKPVPSLSVCPTQEWLQKHPEYLKYHYTVGKQERWNST